MKKLLFVSLLTTLSLASFAQEVGTAAVSGARDMTYKSWCTIAVDMRE
jgi:hypothetical protein